MKPKLSVSVAVAEAVADVEGADPTELDYSLRETIDTDALDALASRTDTDWYLQFTIHGHEVSVASDGTINVDGHHSRWNRDA
jgi:hypothetical protein